jgi:hypothetical protein
MLRLAIRDLLWLTALAAVTTVWWLDHRKKVALEQHNAVLESSRNELESMKATLRAGLGSDKAVASFIQAMKNAPRTPQQSFVRVSVPVSPPGKDIRPAIDPNGIPPKYPRFAQPLTPTWPPR